MSSHEERIEKYREVMGQRPGHELKAPSVESIAGGGRRYPVIFEKPGLDSSYMVNARYLVELADCMDENLEGGLDFWPVFSMKELKGGKYLACYEFKDYPDGNWRMTASVQMPAHNSDWMWRQIGIINNMIDTKVCRNRHGK